MVITNCLLQVKVRIVFLVIADELFAFLLLARVLGAMFALPGRRLLGEKFFHPRCEDR